MRFTIRFFTSLSIGVAVCILSHNYFDSEVKAKVMAYLVPRFYQDDPERVENLGIALNAIFILIPMLLAFIASSSTMTLTRNRIEREWHRAMDEHAREERQKEKAKRYAPNE